MSVDEVRRRIIHSSNINQLSSVTFPSMLLLFELTPLLPPPLPGPGNAAEVQGLDHQAGARGVQLHASEPVRGVPVLPPVP